jgi:membrane-bound ClpP family serine protease
MVGNLLALVGIILVILGVLKLVGLLALGSASAAVFIVVGAICVLVAYFVFGGLGSRTRL